MLKRYSVPRVFTCGADPAGAKGACDTRDDAAADRALGDGEHQRNERKNRRDAGKSIHAQLRYEIDLEQCDKDLDAHDGGVGDCKPQDRWRDRSLEQHAGAGVDFSGSRARLPLRVLALEARDGRRGNRGKSNARVARLPAALFGSRKLAGSA